MVSVEGYGRVFVERGIGTLVIVVGDVVVVVDVVDGERGEQGGEGGGGVDLTVLHEEGVGCGMRFMRDVSVDKVSYKLGLEGEGGGTEESEEFEVWHVFLEVF